MTEYVDISYLLPELRIQIGDTTPETYRYLDDWLNTSLLVSVKSLGRWWNYKYLVESTTNEIYRNPNVPFMFAEPPVIEPQDERPIVVLAAYMVLSGSLENSAWDFVSWKDAEISYSNLESSRARTANLTRLWDELTSLLPEPTKKLSFSKKAHMPGYVKNIIEYD